METHKKKTTKHDHFGIITGMVLLALLVPLTLFVLQKESDTRTRAQAVPEPSFGALGPCPECNAPSNPLRGNDDIMPDTLPSVFQKTPPCVVGKLAVAPSSSSPSQSVSQAPMSSGAPSPYSAPSTSTSPDKQDSDDYDNNNNYDKDSDNNKDNDNYDNKDNQKDDEKKMDKNDQKSEKSYEKKSKHKKKQSGKRGEVTKGTELFLRILIELLNLLLKLLGTGPIGQQPGQTINPGISPNPDLSPGVSPFTNPNQATPTLPQQPCPPSAAPTQIFPTSRFQPIPVPEATKPVDGTKNPNDTNGNACIPSGQKCDATGAKKCCTACTKNINPNQPNDPGTCD